MQRRRCGKVVCSDARGDLGASCRVSTVARRTSLRGRSRQQVALRTLEQPWLRHPPATRILLWINLPAAPHRRCRRALTRRSAHCRLRPHGWSTPTGSYGQALGATGCASCAGARCAPASACCASMAPPSTRAAATPAEPTDPPARASLRRAGGRGRGGRSRWRCRSARASTGCRSAGGAGTSCGVGRLLSVGR
jgi:hypothetical protein